MPRTSRQRQAVAVSDSLLGLVLLVGGVVVVAAGILDLMPSTFAFAGASAIAGVLVVFGAFVGRTQAGFWAELVPGALLLAFATLLVRYPPADARGLAALASFVFLAGGVVRLGAGWEFPSLSTIFTVSGGASILMGGLLMAEVRPVTLGGVAILLGIELVIVGLTAMLVSRADHPNKRG